MVDFLLFMALCWGPGHGSEMMRPMWYHPYPETWQNAQTICQSEHGGDLLTVVSQAELDVMNFTSYHAWIGLTKHLDHFHWDDAGNAEAPLAWVAENDCAVASYQKNSPQSEACTIRHFFFCKGLFSNVFVPQTKSYADAKAYCQTLAQNLSTFPGKTSLDFQGSPLYQPREFPVWIGLFSSDPGSTPSPDTCVSVGSQSKSMSVHSCSDAYPFVCYNTNLVLLQELMTWEQALEHCKNLSSSSSFRLLSVDQNNMDPIKNILRFTQTKKVWVGLRFLAGSWFWSDGSTLPLPSLPSCPGFTLGCGALVVSSGSDPVIEPSDCSEKFNLLCYEEQEDETLTTDSKNH